MVLDVRKGKRATRCGGSGTSGSDLISSFVKKTTKKSRRKTRTKIRKPKYLSLRLQLSGDQKPQESCETPCSTVTTSSSTDRHHPHLNLFPLHPENLVDEKDAHDENMAYLFYAGDGGATTLTGLLGAPTTSSSDEDNKHDPSATTLSPSALLAYAYARRYRTEEEVALVRTAMRNKEREPSEERLVRLSEVVDQRREDQEVSSCIAADIGCWRNQRLSLKLDYEEILNEWSDKGSLYIHAAPVSPQTVPDIHDDILASELSNGNIGGPAWRVPELIKVKAEEQQEQQGVVGVGQRAASVQRYKEKRQKRLFAKKIRYQVRKLNAEKRPRLKGRFVKRN